MKFIYRLLVISLLAVPVFRVAAQPNNPKVAIVAFYNVENLFDTENDPLKNDEDFLPEGSYQWTPERYAEKLRHLSDVISLIGKEFGGPVILGVSEIENRKVLEDLAATPKLQPFHFGVAHHDSPDRRGVDVGLFYNKDRFRVLEVIPHPLIIPDDTAFKTRDQLLVVGVLDNTDTLHVVVNHWPSKRGGEKRSMPKRAAAAELSRHIADSIKLAHKDAKVIIMGDLNDNPDSKSIMNVLGTKVKIKDVEDGDLFNPMWQLYRDGIWSYLYQDSPNVIDNIIVSSGLLNPRPNTYKFVSAHIFRAKFMFSTSGSFAGYPMRTYAAGTYQGGYSDHLPVYIILQK